MGGGLEDIFGSLSAPVQIQPQNAIIGNDPLMDIFGSGPVITTQSNVQASSNLMDIFGSV